MSRRCSINVQLEQCKSVIEQSLRWSSVAGGIMEYVLQNCSVTVIEEHQEHADLSCDIR